MENKSLRDGNRIRDGDSSLPWVIIYYFLGRTQEWFYFCQNVGKVVTSLYSSLQILLSAFTQECTECLLCFRHCIRRLRAKTGFVLLPFYLHWRENVQEVAFE